MHVKAGYLRDKRIQKILEEIPLETLFSPEQLQRFVLQDSPVLFYYRDENNVRTVSAPHMISMMTSMLELSETDRVLILGSKGGFIEGVIAKAVKDVFILEEHEEVAAITEEGFIKLGLKNIWVRRQNPMKGLVEEEPFNKILITGAIPFLPQSILDQLAPNGILVMPLMMMHPNQQTIIQLRKKSIELEIVNFGGVIFQPIYSTELPPYNPESDLAFDKLLKIAKENVQPDLIQQKDFFEEFTQMPKVEIQQVFFAENDQISISINDSEIDSLILKKKIKTIAQKNGDVQIIIRSIHVALYNTEEKAALIQIEYSQPNSNNREKSEFIKIRGLDEYDVQIDMKIPLIEGSYPISYRIMDAKHYRTGHVESILHVFHMNQNWTLSLEFEGTSSSEEEEPETAEEQLQK